MSAVVVLLAVSCFDSTKQGKGRDPASTYDSASSIDTSPVDSDDTGRTDTGPTPGDTSDTGSDPFPVFDCPAPPPGAIEIDLEGYTGDQSFANSAALGTRYGWYFNADGSNDTADTCAGDDIYQRYFDHEPGYYSAGLSVVLPSGYPPGYQGIWADLPGLTAVPGVQLDLFWYEGDSFRTAYMGSEDDPPWDDYNTTLCLSRVRPDRVSGTFLFEPGATYPEPSDLFITFDLVADPDGWANDGTCFTSPLYDGYDDPDAIWSEEYWESTGMDTGGDSG